MSYPYRRPYQPRFTDNRQGGYQPQQRPKYYNYRNQQQEPSFETDPQPRERFERQSNYHRPPKFQAEGDYYQSGPKRSFSGKVYKQHGGVFSLPYIPYQDQSDESDFMKDAAQTVIDEYRIRPPVSIVPAPYVYHSSTWD